MKKLIIAAVVIVAAIVGGLGLYREEVLKFLKNEVIVVTSEPETIVKTERVDNLEVLIKEAQEEAQPTIEKEAQTVKENEVQLAQAAFDAAVEAAEAKHNKYITTQMAAVSDKVKEDYIAEIEATIEGTSY